MNGLTKIFEKKIKTVYGQKNLNKLQKKKKMCAFINKCLYIIDLVQTRENQKNSLHLNDEFKKITSGDYSYVSREDFLVGIKKEIDLNECLKYLKNEGFIECRKVDGREYYIHWQNVEKHLEKCPKAYKLTDKCKQIFANLTEQEFNDFYNKFKDNTIPRRKYVPTTPKQVMAKVKEDFWFKNTKENIEHVLNNNLELEFHPTSVQELVDSYNKQRLEEGEKKLTREQIEVQIAHKIDEYANKDFSYNVRLYNAFTRTPRCWRKFVTTKDGNKIDELFDIHSSVLNILPIVCRIVLLKNNQSTQSLDKEEQILNYMFEQGDIYEKIGSGVFKRDQIKDALMKVLFSNNKSFENIANIEYTPQKKVKKTAANTIRIWLRDNFPTMFNVLANFEQKYINNSKSKWTKFKSQYWKAFQQIETELMCELNQRVERKFGIKVYGLHDGCFLDSCMYATTKNEQVVKYCESEYKKLKEELKQLINNKYSLKEQVMVKEVAKEVVNEEVKEEVKDEELDVDSLMEGYEEATNKVNEKELWNKLKNLKREEGNSIHKGLDEYANEMFEQFN